MIEQIKEKLKLSNYEVNQLSSFDAIVLKKAWQRFQSRSDITNPFRYLLKAAEGIQSESAKAISNKQPSQQREQVERKPLTTTKLKEDAEYYSFDKINQCIRDFTSCLALAGITYGKYPNEINKRWIESYTFSLNKWETILKFKQESNTINETQQKQSNVQTQEKHSTNSNVVDIDNTNIDYSLFEEDFSSLGF